MERKALASIEVAFITLVVAAAAVLFLYPYAPKQPPKARDAGWTMEGVEKVVSANNKFALELYSELTKLNDGNIFFSPYSISSALAMAYEGARGKTADEIKSVFHFPERDVLEPNFAKVYNSVNEKNGAYELRTGNALWVQKGYRLLEDYKGRVEKYYGGKASNVDFIKENEKSRQTINRFIEEQTSGKVKDLIPEGMLDPATRLVITNAIYFKGAWKWKFDKGDTREMGFHLSPHRVVKAQMMHLRPSKATFNYTETEKLQILELPYKGNKISMLILLPKQGKGYDFERGETIVYNYTLRDVELTIEKLNEWRGEMKETKIDAIYLPKFELETKYFMKDTLSTLGMSTAFSGGADFSGITGSRDLFINQVVHQAHVKVDEEGTEAAAATGVGMQITAARGGPFFRADHPFIFIIQERETGNILFMGRVTDPTK